MDIGYDSPHNCLYTNTIYWPLHVRVMTIDSMWFILLIAVCHMFCMAPARPSPPKYQQHWPKSAGEMIFLLWTLKQQQRFKFKLCGMWSNYMYSKQSRFSPLSPFYFLLTTEIITSSLNFRSFCQVFIIQFESSIKELWHRFFVIFFTDSKGFPPWDVGKRSWPYCEHSQFSWSRRCQRPRGLLC